MTLVDVANAAVNGVVIGLLLALPALAVTLVFGIARFPNAATGDFMTFGAYTAVAAKSLFALPLAAAVVMASAFTALLSLFFYGWVFRALTRRSPISSLIVSIGIALVVRSSITFFAGQSQYTIDMPLVRAWNFGGVRIVPTDLYIAGTAAVALLLSFGLLHLTPLGRRMRAVADNMELARASGINVEQVMVSLFAIVGAFCGLGGVLIGIKAVVLPELGWELLLPLFAAVILGGIGSPLGAICGMMVFSVSQEIASLWVGASYKVAFAFFLLLCVLLVRPQGILGKVRAVR
jgi:branched-chain amino acid transport system permease protein